MNKLTMETKNFTSENIEKIGAMFPAVITEARGEDGKLKKAINFALLKQLLSEDVLEGNEAFELTWVGKKAAMVEAGRPIRKTLRPCKAESKAWETTENLYIEGDNLDVLKLLQESYLGKVKMIYIDPPYNTGNDFIYNDRFVMDKDEYEKQTGLFEGDELKNFKQNIDSNPRFHSDWCSMMYPRLQLARNLLSSDGVIFISIDDNEVENLKNICNEIFGEANFQAIFVIDKTAQGANQSLTFKTQHEFLLMYSGGDTTDIVYEIDSEIDTSKYKYSDKNGRYAITNSFDSINSPLTSNRNRGYTVYYLPETGEAIVKDEYDRENNTFGAYETELMNIGYVPIRPSIRNGVQYPWNWSIDRFKKEYKDELVFLNNREGNLQIYHKNRATGRVKDTTIKRFDTRKSGNQLLTELLETKTFDYPKSLDMMKWVLSKIGGKDVYIMDFFSGSATTAHAVMQLNAEDGGKRKFIMVQLPELTDEKSEAYKAGYKNICDIGKERIRRAGEKIKAELESAALQPGLDEESRQVPDIGFRVFKLDESNMKDVFYNPGDYSQERLPEIQSNVKEDRDDMDLLFACLLEWGLPLSLPHSSEQMDGCTVHSYNDGDLMACFDENITESVVREIARRAPLRVVFRDSSFGSSPEKINVQEIFKLLAPNTSIRVL